jgi:hypothetical protein
MTVKYPSTAFRYAWRAPMILQSRWEPARIPSGESGELSTTIIVSVIDRHPGNRAIGCHLRRPRARRSPPRSAQMCWGWRKPGYGKDRRDQCRCAGGHTERAGGHKDCSGRFRRCGGAGVPPAGLLSTIVGRPAPVGGDPAGAKYPRLPVRPQRGLGSSIRTRVSRASGTTFGCAYQRNMAAMIDNPSD